MAIVETIDWYLTTVPINDTVSNKVWFLFARRASTVLQDRLFGIRVDAHNRVFLAEQGLILGQRIRNRLPDATGAVSRRKLKRRVEAPAASRFVQDDVAGNQLHVRSCHSLAQPSCAHLKHDH